MSQDHHEEAHEGPIKTPKQLAWAVFFAFAVPIVVIILLAYYVSSQFKPAAGSDAITDAMRIAERLKPVASVEVKDASDVTSLKTGEQVYLAQCTACHAVGAAGAPKTGDAAAWGPRLTQGYELLLEHAIKGKGAMGAQGGGDFSDFEIGRAVVYLANKSGGKLAEPAPPVAASAPQ